MVVLDLFVLVLVVSQQNLSKQRSVKEQAMNDDYPNV